jgi:uncharacterized protein
MVDLNINREDLEKICKDNQVEFLGVFGSVARGEDRPESDVDLLVRFAPDSRVGLFGLVRMGSELEQLLGRKVDLLTEGFLSKYFRDEVVAEAKPIYVKTE